MDLPSGRRLRRSSPPPPKHGAVDPGEVDRISTLPDDMLLQILARLRSARSAACAGVLTHRWRFLWTRLLDLVFHDVSAGKIQEALARVALPGISLLDVRLPRCRTPVECKLDESRAKLLLHAAARLSPKELDLDLFGYNECQSIDIVTSMLKKLKLIVYANLDLVVSISAPMVETVSLLRMYGNAEYPIMFGFWLLQNMRSERIHSIKSEDDGVLNDKGEVACSQLPRSHILSLDISAPIRLRLGSVLNIAQEMEKFMVTNISVIEVHLNPRGHTFTSFVSRFLRTRHIRTTARRLAVILPEWSEVSQTSKCTVNCPCQEPGNWRSKSISLNRLEEVEIYYFRGGELEIDFVALILGWAPKLKRMAINLAHEIKQSEIGSCATTIYNTCLAYPSVKCTVYRSSGET